MDCWDYRDKNADVARIFNECMTEFTHASLPAILAEYDFSKATHVVDVGGGEGHLIGGILKQWPHLRGTLFDLPSVIEKARQISELDGRLAFAGGSFFKDSVPENGNLYIMQRVIHDWDDESSIKILSNVRRTFPREGKLVLLEAAIHPGETDKLRFYADLLMLVIEDGKERTREQFSEILKASGFKLTRLIRTRSFLSIVEAECA